MPLTLPCPACKDPQTVPDEAVGHTVRCQTCQAEFRATAAAPVAPPWESKPRRRILPWVISLLVLGGISAVIWYFMFWTGSPTDYADPAEVFSARFPNVPESYTASNANPAMLRIGEQVTRTSAGGRDYSITVVDGLNPGDQEIGPAGRDSQSSSAMAVTITNLDAEILRQRTTTHDGHVAVELVVRGKDDGRLTAFRAVTGETCQVRMAVSGSGSKDRAEAFLDEAGSFFDTVKLGPAFGPPILEDPLAVSAGDLGAAYKADPKAADARYKGKWVRVTGRVMAVAEDGNAFEVDAGGPVLVVNRAVRARLSVPVGGAGAPVTATGKVKGLEEPTTGPDVRVVLDTATVLRLPGGVPPSKGGPPPKK